MLSWIFPGANPRDMDPAVEAICEQHGVLLRSEALTLGYNDRTLARLVRDETWHRVRHGAYVSRATWDTLNAGQRHLLSSRAAFRTADTKVALSHTSSLMVHEAEWWDLPLTDVHLTRIDGRTGRREAGVRQHQGRVLPGDVEFAGALAYMSATRSALEITTLTDVEHSLVVIDSMLHHKKTTEGQLTDRYASSMTQWPNTLTTGLVLRLCDGRAESPGESRSRYLFHRYGLPAPEPQFEIRDGRGTLVAILDFAWPELGVFFEFDGLVKYSRYLRKGETPADAVVREKRREELICGLTGWVCVRITWADLYQPAKVVAQVRRAFAQAATKTRVG